MSVSVSVSVSVLDRAAVSRDTVDLCLPTTLAIACPGSTVERALRVCAATLSACRVGRDHLLNRDDHRGPAMLGAMRASRAFREQAAVCGRHGSPMYAVLLDRLADDIDAGGPTTEVVVDHEDDPGSSALALRVAGGVHRLVLERRAGSLAAYYPTVGGTWDDELGPARVIELLASERDAVREWLDRAPQTNEVGRAVGLMGALLHLPDELRLPVRLLEIGSSAGLQQLADRFAYVDDRGQVFGDADSPLRLDPAWSAAALDAWPSLRFIERRGCDLAPVDVATTAGRLALTAYVWADQIHRFERLRAALDLARATPPEVRRMGAADFVDSIDLRDGALTVLWHSVMWQYLDAEEQRRIEARVSELGRRATATAPFVHVSLEPTGRALVDRSEFEVTLTAWPGGERRLLGHAVPHGPPVTWRG